MKPLVQIDQKLHNGDVEKRVILLFYHGMIGLGGIETLIYRIARYQIEMGVRVIIVCRQFSENIWGNQIEYASIDDIKNLNKMISIYKNIDIFSFAPISFAHAYLFCQSINYRDVSIRLCLGVYHPRDMFRENEGWHIHYLNRIIYRFFDKLNLVFMNKDCFESHANRLGLVKNSKVIPIFMSPKKKVWLSHKQPKSIRIVSVGRIVPFKSYNFHIPLVARFLTERGIHVKWDIYGHGSHEKDLADLIKQFGVEIQVRHINELPFDQFDDVVLRYELFLGMGTSAVQAAQLGLPTLLAIDSNPDKCYGFIHEVPFGNVGEYSPELEVYSICERILDFLRADDLERERISLLCAQSTALYASNEYIEKCLENSNFSWSIRSFINVFIIRIYLLGVEKSRLTALIGTIARRIIGYLTIKNSTAQ